MRRLFVAFVFVLFTPTALIAGTNTPAGTASDVAAPVMMKSHVVVDGSVVLLSDLFEGAGEQGATAIARAPAPGKRVEVSARWLAAVAKAYGLDWQPTSRLDSAVVERSSQIIDTRRIEQEMLDTLARRGVTGRLSLVLDQPGIRLDLPGDAEPTLSIANLSHDPLNGRFTALVVAPATGIPLAKASISGRVVSMTEIPVLRRRMGPGEVIREDDVEWSSTRADRLGRGVIIDVENLLGMSPRRPIRPGEAVQANQLQAPVVVAKNSLITIRLDTARLSLTAQGRALESGASGDVIRVMNTKSSKIINAAVVGSGTVRVVAATLSSANE
jgi:flagellar basal body P-ring formation protein FlgA